MKTLDLLIIISIATGIMVFFGIFVLSNPHVASNDIKLHGLGLKLSSTHIDTPGTVLLYISSSKDATPNKYKMGVWAGTNTIEQGSLSMRTDIGIIVKHQNDLK